MAYLELLELLELRAIFRILAYVEPNIYSELCQDIFWHIQSAVCIAFIMRILPYSESCLYRHIQAYLKMVVTIMLTFFFFSLILHIFHQN